MEQVQLNTIEGVFERHGYPASSEGAALDAPSLYNVLLEIFSLSRGRYAAHFDKHQAAEILLNWVLNLYNM